MNSKEQLNTKETAEQERSQFNILNDLDSAVNAMATIEGVEEISKAMEWTPRARKRAEEIIEQIKNWTPLDDEDRRHPPILDSIYGNGGVHRYMIRANGDILYSAFHSSVDPENIDRAKELGFEIHH